MNFALLKRNAPLMRTQALFALLLMFFVFPANAQDCTEEDDVEQLMKNSFANLIPTQGNGQSFTAPCTGRIKAITIDVNSVNESPIVGTLRVFEGSNGAAGAEIATAPYSFADAGLQTTTFAGFVPVEAGQSYTYFVDAPTSGSGNTWSFNGDPYSGGRAFSGPDASNLTPFASDDTFIIDLAPATCTHADNIEQLMKNSFANLIPTQGNGQSFIAPCTGRIKAISIDVNSVNESPIVGTLRVFEGSNGAAGAEIGTAPYSFAAAGLQATAFDGFVSVEAGQAYTYFVDAPTSGSGNTWSYNGNPYAGGRAVSGPDASNLTPFGSDDTFSIDLAPAACTDEDEIAQSRVVGFVNFKSDQGAAQGFTAPCHGEVRAIAINLATVDSSPINGMLRVFEGGNTSGAEIARSMYSFTATGLQSVAMPYPFAVEAGSTYSFFVDAPTSGQGNIAASNGNPYTGGGSYIGTVAGSLGGLAGDLTFSIDLRPAENVSASVAALTAFYFSTGGDSWVNNDNWLTGALNTWHGIATQNGDVTGINLQGNGLAGELPADLGSLSALRTIEFSQNALTGAIPAEIGGLDNLTFFSAYENQLNGAIPNAMGNMSSLEHLQLGQNALTGDMPAELGDLSALTALLARGNDFTGGIPGSYGSLSNLTAIDLSGNAQMTGTLPIELTQLSNMSLLNVGGTSMCDNLDPAFQSWLGTIGTVVSAGCVNVSNDGFSDIPSAFALKNNYPNPFNPTTTIHFDVPKLTEVRLEIFDIQGRLIETLVDGQLAAGRYERQWNAENVASGTYLYRLTAGDFSKTQHMVLLK